LADLGVDSMMAVELETIIRNVLGVDVPLGFLASENVTMKLLSRRLAESIATLGQQTPNDGDTIAEPVPTQAVAEPVELA
jgi:hypothetical protein